MAKKQRFTNAQLLEAIKNSQGIISTVQAHMKKLINENISWHSIDNAIKESPTALRAMQDEKEAMLDISENIVFQEILKHDVSTAKWYLKMKGQDRGYKEETTLQVANKDPLNININGDLMNAQQLQESDTVEIPNYDEPGKD